MGKGVALVFKKHYPEMFVEYQEKCKNDQVKTGEPYLYKDSKSLKWILNFPTKKHWKSISRLEYIEAGLQTLANKYEEWGITSLAMPALGCGNGGLNWLEVKRLIEKYLKNTAMYIEVYEPGSGIESSSLNEKKDQIIYQTSLFGDKVDVTTKPKKGRKKRQK